MSYHQRPHELRLAIPSEAEALFSGFGDMAYAEACRRDSEASSDSLAKGLERCRGNDRSQVGNALIPARRFIRLNKRIRGPLLAFRSAGILPPSISTQHTLKKADLLGDYIDRLLSRHRLGNRCPSIDRF
jgi:hypothetical protein